MCQVPLCINATKPLKCTLKGKQTSGDDATSVMDVSNNYGLFRAGKDFLVRQLACVKRCLTHGEYSLSFD